MKPGQTSASPKSRLAVGTLLCSLMLSGCSATDTSNPCANLEHQYASHDVSASDCEADPRGIWDVEMSEGRCYCSGPE